MSKNTVFVIGAGASKEANLPTGNDLKKEISELFDFKFDVSMRCYTNGDNTILNALRLLVKQHDGRNGDINQYINEAMHIRDALPLAISIDNFIDTHRGNAKIAICGKLAIVKSILNAEKNSLLYFETFRERPNNYFKKIEKTWYSYFFKLITENCSKNDLMNRFKTITLIIFNYDRCVEHFIYYALKTYYQISSCEAAELIKNINIYHPYGSVGSLPWIANEGIMEFGSETSHEKLLELVGKIKTFTEGTDPNSSEILKIREHINLADRLVFMGFAFHKLNMELISPAYSIDHAISYKIKCFATTYGSSENDQEVIRKQISSLYSRPKDIQINSLLNISKPDDDRIEVQMKNISCSNFFTEYWISLAF